MLKSREEETEAVYDYVQKVDYSARLHPPEEGQNHHIRNRGITINRAQIYI